jgi:glycosyltransferase involved in cell wall biosynthesis
MISVVILTLNEEKNLPGCLKSLSWCTDVVIFDSNSDDSTVEIAEKAGARVRRRAFDNYAAQRNAALSTVHYRNPWVLMLDADERTPGALVQEMQAAVQSAGETTLFRMRRKDIFMGRWLRRSSGYPTWFGRLMKVGHVSVRRAINEEFHTDGAVSQLDHHIVHYPFNKGVNYWIERHNRYSDMEAEQLIRERERTIRWQDLLSSDPAQRRAVLKQMAFRLPIRPWLVFAYLYLLRFGFLDGRAGLTFCALRSMYEYMIDIKVREQQRRAADQPV